MLPTRLITVGSFAILLLIGSATAQTTYVVDDDAPLDPGPGDPLISDPLEDGSAAHPFDAISEAVLAALNGDVVLLRNGYYAGTGNAGVTVNESITVMSEHGAASCVIEPIGDFAFRVLSADPEFRGLTIRNGSATSGGAIRMQGGAAATIVECVFEANFASNGGAIYVENSSTVITSSVFLNNNASNGGAICVRLGSQAEIVNCSFTANTALFGGAIFAADSSQTTVRNSILWANQGAGQGKEVFVGFNTGGVTVTIGTSDVDGGVASVQVDPGATLVWAPGNIDADPLFAGGFGADVYLLSASPCIDAGDTSLVGPDDRDFDLDPRVAQGTVDMGADEYVPRFYITGDKSPGGFITLNIVGPPAASPVLLFASSGLLDSPLPTSVGPWQLALPPFPAFPISLGALSPSGGAMIFTQLPPSTPVGFDLYTQTVIGSSLSNPHVLNIEP